MYFILLGGEEPERVATGVVSWDYFETLGVKRLLGRTFRAADDAHDAPGALILSHESWQRAFRGSPDVVGRVVEMNDRRHTIVGVLQTCRCIRRRTTSTCRGRRAPSG